MHTPADEQVARALLTLHGGGESGPLIDGSPVLGAGPYDTVYVLARTGDGAHRPRPTRPRLRSSGWSST